MKLVLLILIFGISFTQDKNIEKKESKKSKIIFSNDQSTDEYLKVFKKSLELLKTNYVDSINESEIILSGIKGMMKPLDPFTKLLMDQSKETYDHLRKGKYGGIGIQIGLRRDTLTVLGTFENSPAYSEGIQVGDNIMQIDTISTKNLTLKECSGLIKGELDSVVTLHIYRSSTKGKIKFDLTRSNIPLKHVPYWGINEDKIGYIRITKFSKNSDKDFKEGLRNLSEKHLEGLIIDLRGNSGGLLKAAINILDNLTERGEILLEQRGKTNKSNRIWKSRRSPIIDSSIPIAILINRKSASASEIVSGALQDLDRAIVIGQKSFGKGLVQHMYDLNDSSTLKITTAKFYLPSGRLIQKQDYLNNGFLTDGLDKKDSVFTTKKGRIVEGGGGIFPDVVTEPNQYSSFVNALWKEKVFLTFAADYAPKHPELKDKFEKEFAISNKIMRDFKNFIKFYDLNFFVPGENNFNKIKKQFLKESIVINKNSHNISTSVKNTVINDLNNYFKRVKKLQFSLPENLLAIKNGLLREFSRVMYNEEKRIEVSLINDIEYNEAVEILNSKNEYFRLLGF